MVEYDDRSSSEEAVRAIERLITQDKVDIVLPRWGTVYNLAVAPMLAKYGYPQITIRGYRAGKDADSDTAEAPQS